MYKFLYFIILASLLSTQGNGQIFKEDFDGNGPGISEWITLDLDGNILEEQVNFITNGWNRINRNGDNGNYGGPRNNYAAMSTSYYSPPGTANDWLISPLIDLTSAPNPTLAFDIKSQDPSLQDGFLLKLSPSGSPIPNDFTEIIGQAINVASEWTKLTFDLTPYKDKKIRFALINNSTMKFILLADNFVVTEDVPPQEYCGPLIFSDEIEPITLVQLNDLIQITEVNDERSHIMYLNEIANLIPGETYDIALSGTTSGDFVNRFAVFIDWDQDFKFNDSDETILVKELLFNSTGTDGKKVVQSFTVPLNAKKGSTRMRIKKTFGYFNLLNPCVGEFYGQAQDFTINVGEPLSYCLPELDCSDGDNITHVKFAGIDNASTCNEETGYSDFTNLSPAVVEIGTTVPIEVTVGSGFAYESVSVWIDYNKNGTFDEDEFTLIGTGSGSTILGSISIPADVIEGTYRMRIRNVAAEGTYTDPKDSCDESLYYGETEDYLVKIMISIPPVVPICNQEVESNHFENAFLFGGEENQRLAIDIFINKNEEMKISSVNINHSESATNFQLFFYKMTDTGLVGDLVLSTTTNIESQDYIGEEYGSPFFTTKLSLNTPVILEAVEGSDTSYWMEIVTDADAWEVNTSHIFGQPAIYANNGTNGEWETVEAEMVYAIIGECSTLSLSELINGIELEFNFYPNPVYNILTIESKQTIGRIEVFNLEGKQILNLRSSKVNDTKTTVNMVNLPKGIYIVRAEIDGRIKTFKIIKK